MAFLQQLFAGNTVFDSLIWWVWIWGFCICVINRWQNLQNVVETRLLKLQESLCVFGRDSQHTLSGRRHLWLCEWWTSASEIFFVLCLWSRLGHFPKKVFVGPDWMGWDDQKINSRENYMMEFTQRNPDVKVGGIPLLKCLCWMKEGWNVKVPMLEMWIVLTGFKRVWFFLILLKDPLFRCCCFVFSYSADLFVVGVQILWRCLGSVVLPPTKCRITLSMTEIFGFLQILIIDFMLLQFKLQCIYNNSIITLLYCTANL